MSAEIIPAIILASLISAIMPAIFLGGIHTQLMRIARALEERNRRG